MVECDVILRDGTLWAAHTPKDMRPGKTLKNVYIDPLIELLNKANPATETEGTWQGIFPGAPKQSLYLLIDVVRLHNSCRVFALTAEAEKRPACDFRCPVGALATIDRARLGDARTR